jgi:F0F1-type ATP synthase assembly protein I
MAAKSEWAKNLGLFSLILSELLGFTGLGVLVGYIAQTYAYAPGWLAFAAAVFGFSLGIYRVYIIANRANSSSDFSGDNDKDE